MNDKMIKVRFAPSPTGELHLGGARTALFNWLFAKKNCGQFYVRIEDTDRDRSKQEYVDQICDSLKWLGLDWDGPLVFQSERGDAYQEAINTLVKEDRAYRCFCPKDVLDAGRTKADRERREYRYPGTCRKLDNDEEKDRLNRGEAFTVRLKIPGGETSYSDLIYGSITVQNSEIDDFIIARSDGNPTYNLTCVVDDNGMGITHVIRGEDHVPNTPKQLLIYISLGHPTPEFAHLPMILGPDKKRLSKRHGAAGVQHFREAGYLPDSLINYLALLGWNPDTEEEIFTRAELTGLFDISQVQKKGAAFDEKKLHWVSGRHIFRLSDEKLFQEVRNLDSEWGGGQDKNYLMQVIKSLKERVKSLNELIESSSFYFYDPVNYDLKTAKKRWKEDSVNEVVARYIEHLETLDNWTEAELEDSLRRTADEESVGGGKIIHPVRLALTGIGMGPSLFELMGILGRETCLRRLKIALEKLPQSD